MNTQPDQTTFDFGDGNGPVLAHRHTNPDGTEGGWVGDTATVVDTATIGPDAVVYGTALVAGTAQVAGDAQVSEADGDVDTAVLTTPKALKHLARALMQVDGSLGYQKALNAVRQVVADDEDAAGRVDEADKADVRDHVLFAVTGSDVEALLGRTPTDDELDRIGQSIPRSSISEALATVIDACEG